MTNTRIPLRCKSKHCNPMQRTYCKAEAPATFDPTMDDTKVLLQRCALFDREPDMAHLDRASSLWAGIHWYRDLHDRRRILT
jgi:hypothetical protein